MTVEGADRASSVAIDAAVSDASLTTFGDRLASRVAERSSQLVLGLDPDPAKLWPRALELAGGAGDPPAPPAARAARAIAAHCAPAIEAAGEHCVAIKPQVACFERLGAAGWAALQEVSRRGDPAIAARGEAARLRELAWTLNHA